MLQKLIYSITIALLLTLNSYSQEDNYIIDSDSKSLENKISLIYDKITKNEEIIINIKDKTPAMLLAITGKVDTGTINIELVNTKGNTIKTLTVKNENTDNNLSYGEMNEFLKEPEIGNWKIKISSKKVKGNVEIKADFNDDFYIDITSNENNEFKLKSHNIKELTSFSIFNRWGKKVFSTTNLNDSWNGKIDTKVAPFGTYFYIIEAKSTSGQEVNKTGYVYIKNN